MSLVLSFSEGNIEAKTWGKIMQGQASNLRIGDEVTHDVSFEEFFNYVKNVITQKNCYDSEVMGQFINCLRSMDITKGYGTQSRKNGKWIEMEPSAKKLKTEIDSLPKWVYSNVKKMTDDEFKAFIAPKNPVVNPALRHDIQITLFDLISLTVYVLKNTDLNGLDDCRLEFLEFVKNC